MLRWILATCLAWPCFAQGDMGYDWSLFEKHYPELHNVTCRESNATHQNFSVPCKKIEVLAMGWMTAGPVLYFPAARFCFDRMIGLINFQQRILPGYEVVVNWKDDAWDDNKAVRILSRELVSKEHSYAALLHGSDPVAPKLNIMAYENGIPHLGWHVAPEMSDRKLAPWYFRTCTSDADFSVPLAKFFQTMGWRSFAMVFESVYAKGVDVMADVMRASNVSITVKRLVTVESLFTYDIPQIISQMQKTRLRLIFFWTETYIIKPSICGFVLHGMSGIIPFWPWEAPWWYEPGLSGTPYAAEYEADGKCAEDKLVSWAEYSISVTPKFMEMKGWLFGEAHPVACLPGDNAGGEFVKWWFEEFSSHFPGNIPLFNSADTACLLTLMFQHILFEQNKTVEFLTSRTKEVLDLEHAWLKNANIKDGMVSPIRFQHDTAWAGPDNGDMNPVTTVAQLMRGNFEVTPTTSGKFDLLPLGEMPAALDHIDKSGLSHPDTFDECLPGYTRKSKMDTDEKGYFVWSSTCEPCPAGTQYMVIQFVQMCVACAAGTVAPVPGATRCSECPRGKYAANASHCKACQQGFFSEASGSTACKPCLAGSYANGEGFYECQACPWGKYAGGDQNGTKVCFDCAEGTTTAIVGAKSSKDCYCSRGTFHLCQGNMCDKDAANPLADGFCQPCPDGAECVGPTLSPNAMVTNNGQHRAPYVKKGFMSVGLSVFKCTGEGSACPGSFMFSPIDQMCAHQGTGIACAECPENYHWKGDACAKCEDGSIAAVVLLFIALCLGSGVFIFYWNEKSAKVEAIESVLASVTIGVTVSFMQALGVFSRLNFEWPIEFENFLEFIKLIVFDMEFLALGCVFSESLASKATTSLLMPLLLVAVFMIWYPLSICINCVIARFKKFKLDAVLNALGMIFQALYISMVLTVAKAFDCFESPNSERTLRFAPSTICYEGDHIPLIIFSTIAGVVYVLGFMALMSWVVVQAPLKITNSSFALRYKFVFFKYSPTMWWFCLPMMFRSMLISLVTVVSPNDGYMQFLLMLFILVIFGFVHLMCLPYSDRYANHLETGELAMLIIILGIGSWFLADSDGSSNADQDPDKANILSFVLVALLILCIMMVFCVFVYAFYQAANPKKAQEKLRSTFEPMLPSIRAAGLVLQGIDNDHLLKLLEHATYIDVNCLINIVDYITLEVGGVQPKGRPRLPKVATDIRTSTSGSQATGVLVKSMSQLGLGAEEDIVTSISGSKAGNKEDDINNKDMSNETVDI
mmetsp:Transcript_75267/g.130335  ORF Transcript_75267/g.130335 Transcript_75267/m.130335 type:complete len:1260 (-) Transcript_75267:81-3860(-)